MAKTIKMVEVKWLDSQVHKGWHAADEYAANRPTVCYSVGYLVTKNRECFIIVQSLNPENGNFADSMTIPRSCVQEWHYVEGVK